MSTRKHVFYGILALVTLLGLGMTQSARASFMVMLEQVGSNVVATGSGAINLTDLTFQSHGSSGSGMTPSMGILTVGIAGNTLIYTGFSGPTSFGSGLLAAGGSDSGNIVGIFGGSSPPVIIVPQGYVSGNALSDSSTFSGTFASLGLTPGTYEWTWGTGINADSFTLDIVAPAVPDSGSTVSLLGCALLGLAALRRKLSC